MDQLVCTPMRAVLFQCALAGAARHSLQLPVLEFERGDHLRRSVGQNDLLVGSKECVQSLPDVANDGRAARGSFEQAPGRTPAPLDHCFASNVESQPRRTEKGRVLGRWQMANEIDVRGPREVLRILRAAKQE